MLVTTDFYTHRVWVNQPCEHYFTATTEAAAYLEHWGVPAEDISTTGIPIHPAFARPLERRKCLERHGLGGDRPIVLQLAGGFGVGPIESIYRGILDVPRPLEIVVVTGRNPAAKAQLEQVRVPARHRAKVVGFTTEVHDYMAVADLVVSKPGGLTTSEVLASGAGMAIVNPIPGQESRNSDFLLENGAAIKITTIATLTFKLTSLFEDSERLLRLKRNARVLARPQAAYDIARRVLARTMAADRVKPFPKKRPARAAKFFKSVRSRGSATSS
jgi:processive 1,2-diacylglycerol beta-glucosyltransferase